MLDTHDKDGSPLIHDPDTLENTSEVESSVEHCSPYLKNNSPFTERAMHAIADKRGARLLRTRDEFEKLYTSKPKLAAINAIRAIRAILHDSLAAPDFLKYLLQQLEVELRVNLLGIEAETPLRDLNGSSREDMYTVPLSGLATGSLHLEPLMRSLSVPASLHRTFDPTVLRRRVMDDARDLTETIIRDGRMAIPIGHSRGALVGLVSMAMLKKQGKQDLMPFATLISPVTNGVPPHVQQLIKRLILMLNGVIDSKHLKGLEDLLPDSEPVQFWQETLGPEDLVKLAIVQQEGAEGDLLTDANSGLIDGAWTFLTKADFGHNLGPLNRRGSLFKITRDLVAHGANNQLH